jgi:HTH-type transcriptional regulator, sugar sensing transcriptional regulator
VELVQRLTSVGLSAKEAAVYVALTQTGTATVAEIARKAGIKRPTAYGVLEDLVTKGLAIAGAPGQRRSYSIESPRQLLDLPRKQEAALKDLMPELLALADATPSKPRIRFYEGYDGVRRVSEDLLTTRDGEYRYFGAAQDFMKAFGERYLKDYVRRRVALGIHSYAIRVRSREVPQPFLGDSERYLRTVRLLDEPVIGDVVTLYIYDQRVGVVSTLREGYGLVIESRELVAMLTMMWRALWAVAKPPRPIPSR